MSELNLIDLEGATVEHLTVAIHRARHQARAEALSLPAVAGAGVLSSGAYCLLGWSLVNAGAAAESVSLFDGAGAGGQLVAVVALAAGASETRWLGPAGVGLRGGLFQTSGADVSGVVWVAPLHRAGY